MKISHKLAKFVTRPQIISNIKVIKIIIFLNKEYFSMFFSFSFTKLNILGTT